MSELPDQAAEACQRLLNTTALRVERPGGRKRRSFRVFLHDRSVIVTQRQLPERARLEAEVLRALGAQGAPVPELIAFDGVWLVQEDLGPRRLSQSLDKISEADGEALLANAIAGLAAAQQAGRTSGLDQHVVAIGTRSDWITKLARMPTTIGEQLQTPPPTLRTDRLVDQLRPQRPAFIKWDARPANAIAQPDASVSWFDWEHCGSRNPLDDVAWLLCDEYTPEWPEAEARLIARFLPSFLDGSSPDMAHDYLMTFGTLHSCMRLSLILTEKAGGPWWDRRRCLDQDNVGVTLEMALRVCQRGARWAAGSLLGHDLSDWFDQLIYRLGKNEFPTRPSQ